LAAYREDGIEALRAKPVPGGPMKLSAKALRWVHETVTTKSPLQNEI
jgi:transposase